MQPKAPNYLQQLCIEIPTRTVGTAGNRQATDFFSEKLRAFGFDVETPQFDCIDWEEDGARLEVGEAASEMVPSPYTLGGNFRGPLVAAETLEQLTKLDARGQILLLHGELAKEQLMPKNFVFYNPEEHQRIVRLLEEIQPAAIIAATDRDPGLAGGISPFPLIEDGDFDIPSVYTTVEVGQNLLAHLGEIVELEIRAQRTAATGCNVLARKGNPQGARLVFMAHIDAKTNSPGAVDNGTGIVILLLLADLLKAYAGPFDIEITAVNGEDYYAASGEMLYLAQQGAEFKKIALAINMDAAGYVDGKTAYSLYDCPAEIESAIRHIFAGHAELIEGESWYQSDHSMFIQRQVPAMAITSEKFWHLTSHITHTPKDHPAIIDTAKLVTTAQALYDLVLALEKHTINH